MEKREIDLITSVLKKDTSVCVSYLFGSQFQGRVNKYSDVDIAVLFDDKIKEEDYADKQIALITELSRVLQKEIDVVILNRAPLFLKYQVLKEGAKIYERPDRQGHSFEARAIVDYLDFLPVKTRIENTILAKIKEA